MHLRVPSIDQGVQAFIWALVFFLFMWLGSILLGINAGIALVVYARRLGSDLPVRARPRRRLPRSALEPAAVGPRNPST